MMKNEIAKWFLRNRQNTYGDLINISEGNNESLIESICSADEFKIYHDIKVSDRQRLKKFN